MADRRRNKRFVKRCDMEFVSDGVKYTGIASDFSLRGIFIRTNYAKAPDTVLEVVLYLPHGSISRLRVKVQRSWKTPTGRMMKSPTKAGKNRMGVKILEKDAAYLHLIRHLLWLNSPREKTPLSPSIPAWSGMAKR